MPAVNITKRTIASLRPGERPFIVYDAKRPGFGVRVMPSGRMAYIIEYRPYPGGRDVKPRRYKFADAGTLTADGGKANRYTFTDAGAMTPEDARREAGELLHKARSKGGDPLESRKLDRERKTVGELIDDYVANLRKRAALPADDSYRLKPATLVSYIGLLDRYVRPAFARRKADNLTSDDLKRVHEEIRETKPYAANRMFAVVGAMYSFAASKGTVPRGFNPTKDIERGFKFKEKSHKPRFLTAAELLRLGEALREAETVGIPWSIDPAKPDAKHAPAEEHRRTRFSSHAVAAIRLLLFTGCRLREILCLRWEDVHDGYLELPDSKTGAKKVVLNAAAMSVLASLPRIGRYVIAGKDAGGQDEKPRADLRKPWDAVRERAGIPHVRIHDLRHTHASIGVGAGIGLPIIGGLLGHKSIKTTDGYAKPDEDPLRRGSEIIAARLLEAMGDVPEGAPSAEVIELHPNKASI